MSSFQVKLKADRQLGILFGIATLFGSCTPQALKSGGGSGTGTPAPSVSAKPNATPTPIPFNPRGGNPPIPTVQPTVAPTVNPTIAPTVIPTVAPSVQPTANPSSNGVLLFNAIPFVNMEQGKHASDAGVFAILENGGRVVAYGSMTAAAALNGKRISGTGAYAGSQLKINLKSLDSAAPQSGNGQLSICRINDLQNISSANCVKESQASAARPTSWYSVPVPYSVQNNEVVVSNKVYGNGNQVTGGLSLNHIVFSASQGGQVATNNDASSPLVFDLDGDGTISLTPIQEGPKAVFFDLLNLGFKTSTGWVKPNDGLLVADFDGDGVIKDGSQLFGEASRSLKKVGKYELSPFMDGFEALAQYAETDKEMITAKDSIFSKLRIWRDKNQNGIADKGELTSLQEEKIVGISLEKIRLGKQFSWPTIAGNEVRLEGYFVKENGKKGKIFDVWFAQDKKTVAKK